MECIGNLRSHRHLTEQMWLASYFPIDTFMEGVLVGFITQYHVNVDSLGGHIFPLNCGTHPKFLNNHYFITKFFANTFVQRVQKL